VPNTNDILKTNHTAIFDVCPNVNALSFTLKVKTPKGVETSVFFPR
jgi:hypothetical protein